MKIRILYQACLLLAGTLSIIGCIELNTEDKSLPELITVAVSDIKIHSAVLGGFIISDGGAEVTSRGICWGIMQDPEISGALSPVASKGTGRFSCTLSGLEQNTMYYVKAYAINSEGTAYGNQVRFTTNPAQAPTVEIIIELIGYYEVRAVSNITDDGGDAVTEQGLCWSSKENPTIDDNDTIIKHPVDDEFWGEDPYYIINLNPNSVYHARPYAINSVDTSYGNDAAIKTLAVPEVTTDADCEAASESATVRGNLITAGDVPPDEIEIGICYSMNKEPMIDDSHIVAAVSDTGKFVCIITGLTPATPYHFRAYASWYFFRDWDFEYKYAVYGNEVTLTTKPPGPGK